MVKYLFSGVICGLLASGVITPIVADNSNVEVTRTEYEALLEIVENTNKNTELILDLLEGQQGNVKSDNAEGGEEATPSNTSNNSRSGGGNRATSNSYSGGGDYDTNDYDSGEEGMSDNGVETETLREEEVLCPSCESVTDKSEIEKNADGLCNGCTDRMVKCTECGEYTHKLYTKDGICSSCNILLICELCDKEVPSYMTIEKDKHTYCKECESKEKGKCSFCTDERPKEELNKNPKGYCDSCTNELKESGMEICPKCGDYHDKSDITDNYCYNFANCESCGDIGVIPMDDYLNGQYECKPCSQGLKDISTCDQCGEDYTEAEGHDCPMAWCETHGGFFDKIEHSCFSEPQIDNVICPTCGEEHTRNAWHECPRIVCDNCGEVYIKGQQHICPPPQPQPEYATPPQSTPPQSTPQPELPPPSPQPQPQPEIEYSTDPNHTIIYDSDNEGGI